MFIDFTGRSIPTKDAPGLDVTFIPKYEKQGATPNIVAPKLETKPVTLSVNTLRESATIGQLPPYAPITIVPKSIAVETNRANVNNVNGSTGTPVEKEKTLAVMKDA